MLRFGDSQSGIVCLITLPVGFIGVSAFAAVKSRPPGKTRVGALLTGGPTFAIVTLGFILGALCFGGGAALIASCGHYLNMTFPAYSGGDTGLSQRGSIVVWGAVIALGLYFGLSKLVELSQNKQNPMSLLVPWLFSWRAPALIAAAATGYGLTYLVNLPRLCHPCGTAADSPVENQRLGHVAERGAQPHYHLAAASDRRPSRRPGPHCEGDRADPE